MLAGREILGFIDAILVFDSHALQALFLIGLHDQPAQHIAVETANRRRRDHSLGCAAGAHHCVYAGSDDCSRDSGRKITVANQSNASARRPDIRDQLFMARTIEHHHHQVVHIAVQPTRDVLEIVGNGRIQINGVLAGWPHHDFFHVAVRRVE